MSADPAPPFHEALPHAAPGLVEIWELATSDERNDVEPWDAPFDTQTATSGVVKLAKRIAGTVAAWRRQGRLAKDVLILVRRRGALFEAVIRALKNEGIPVAGADRLVLTEHIAVMDLMVLADALLLPEDDLALATALKSPLFGLDDDELFKLAWDRKGSLRASLRAQRPELAARLDALSISARAMTPFAFYADLLGAGHGRKKILSRLGHEANDALDEFLNLALDYERERDAVAAGLRRVAALGRGRGEARHGNGARRGAGDDGARRQGTRGADRDPRRHHDAAAGLASAAASAAAARQGGAGRARAAGLGRGEGQRRRADGRRARGGARRSARRIPAALYVAMTRAIERLIVCGVEGKNKPPEGCWYELVQGALKEHCVTEPADDGAGEVLRYRKTPDVAAAAATSSGTPAPSTAIPDWLDKMVEAAPARAAPIKPSGFVDDPEVVEPFRPSEARQRAILRGNIVHRLMQSLPDIPPERRADAVHQHIARQQTDFSEAERGEIASQVLTILTDPRFALLFSPGSRAEVPIVGRLGDRTVTGVVDRLVVAPDAILIADYKTNRPAPRSLAETKERYQSYVVQLALYRAVLMRLYPGRPVRAALVWTDIPGLGEIPAEDLDAALAVLTTP